MSFSSSKRTVPTSKPRSKSRSRSPRSPPGPPPPSLLEKKENEVTYLLTIKADTKGTLQHVIKQLGADIITKSAWLDFKAIAMDQTTGRQVELTHAEFIGGNVIKLEPTEHSQAFYADTVQVIFG